MFAIGHIKYITNYAQDKYTKKNYEHHSHFLPIRSAVAGIAFNMK